jgi:hypothetical protein
MAAARDLATELKVPMLDVVKALMALGAMPVPAAELDGEEVELVKRFCGLRRPRRLAHACA